MSRVDKGNLSMNSRHPGIREESRDPRKLSKQGLVKEKDKNIYLGMPLNKATL